MEKQQATAANAATLNAFGSAKWAKWGVPKNKKAGAAAPADAAAAAPASTVAPAAAATADVAVSSAPRLVLPGANPANPTAAPQPGAAAPAPGGGGNGGGSAAAAAAGALVAGLPQRSGARTLRLRDLVAALEHEPMHAKSVLLYQLYEQLG